MPSRIKKNCSGMFRYLSGFKVEGTKGWQQSNECGNQLEAFEKDIESYLEKINETDPLKDSLEKLKCKIFHKRQDRCNDKGGYLNFGVESIWCICEEIEKVVPALPEGGERKFSNEDLPIRFDVGVLADCLESVAALQGDGSINFISTMVMRIKMMLGDTRMKGVIAPDKMPTLSSWLNEHIGSNSGDNGPVAVIDLSLVPCEILHLVIAISSRLILESLQRYRNINHKNLPTVLVLEEAHTFVRKRLPHGDEIPSPADMCRGIFERVAREGRKFGLGLVLSSQRPSELSETVLSQCNSFLLHRITNDRDQELISRLVPDNTRGLLRELPSLPTRHCILLGIASKVPTLVEVKHLKDDHRPESDDPDFWNVWSNEKPRPIDWEKIARDWSGSDTDTDTDDSSEGDGDVQV